MMRSQCKKKPLIQIILGSFLGTITLIPYIIDRVKNSVGHVDQLESNIVFSFEKVGDLFKMFGRFLTFPTAEITRFMGRGRGFQQALETVGNHLWLTPVFIISMTVSVLIVVMTLLRFYFKKPQSRLDLWVVLLPLATGFMFLFSIKGPSAHTFWALFPISIYPIIMRWNRFPQFMKSSRFMSIYFASSILLMLGGVLPNVGRPYIGGFSLGVNSAQAAFREKALRVFLPQDVVTLDWNQTASAADFPVILNLQEGLIEIDELGKVHPLIAQSWRVSKDGRKFNFTLNKNILWSDDKPLSADDFVSSWKRVMNPANGFSTSYMMADIEEVTALSTSELEVKLKTQNFNWYLRTASPNFFPIRQSLVTKSPNLWTKPGAMITLGPFTLAEHNENQSFTLKRNPSYFSARPQFDRLEFVIGALEEGLILLKNDKVDMVFHAPVESLTKLPKNALLSYHAPQLTKRLEFNFVKYPTGLQKFRKAIAQAIPRDALAKEMGKRFVPAGSYVPSGFMSYDAKGGVAYDPVIAKKAIREMFSLNTVTLDVLVPCFDAAREDNIRLAQFLKKELKKSIGIDLRLKLEPDQKRYALMRDTKDWHILIRDFSGSFFDPAYYYEPYGTGARYGKKWQSTSYDDALMFAKSSQSEKERESWFKKCDEELTRNEIVLVPLVYQKAISILGPRISKIRKKYYDPYILKSVELK
ncbi:MAG: peptide ABC transporter substrate-binding protein [Xanthomonadaceae bacterium]|nr:peptide ABC transporter substrate-binding protein [Xanthomonadaceae bacterium]